MGFHINLFNKSSKNGHKDSIITKIIKFIFKLIIRIIEKVIVYVIVILILVGLIYYFNPSLFRILFGI